MAKPGAGKRKMQANRQKQWNRTVKSLNNVRRALKGGGRKKKGCYIATCVYGSYDCPEVWTLRRFRDETLEQSWFGRRFISLYYTISPTLVSAFGGKDIVRKIWKALLDTFVKRLIGRGVSYAPYSDD